MIDKQSSLTFCTASVQHMVGRMKASCNIYTEDMCVVVIGVATAGCVFGRNIIHRKEE